jgi:hypothetical protein
VVTPAIVVAFRMAPGEVRAGSGADVGARDESRAGGTYLERARALCARAEALGARLVAWSATALAVAWDPDSLEEAIALAAGVRDGASSAAGAWACGIAEGPLETLAAQSDRDERLARVALSWGEVLVTAVALACVAQPGEVLVDGDLGGVRTGQLATDGVRSATEGGRPIRGWRLNLDHPWRTIDPSVASDTFEDDEIATADVLRIIEAAADDDESEVESNIPTNPVPSPAREGEPTNVSQPPASGRQPALGPRLREVLATDAVGEAVELLPALRRVATGARGVRAGRARFELAVALSVAGRRDDALLEALDALARAREHVEPALGAACLALLAKLYTAAGWPDAGRRLGELALTTNRAGS